MKRLYNYSQNFLVSPRLVHELVGHSNLRKNDFVIDIGAGSGVISSVLARRAKRVLAIENESKTAHRLRQNMAKFPNVEVVEADFLQFKLPSEKYKIFANIPFHLSSEIVQKLIWADSSPVAIYLILQKQFAKKLVIDRDNFTGQLGAMIAPWWTTRIRRPLKRSDFYPRPNVDTVLLEIKPRETALINKRLQCKYCDFIQRSYSEQKFFAGLDLEGAGIDAEKKPSELTSHEWVRLFVKSHKN